MRDRETWWKTWRKSMNFLHKYKRERGGLHRGMEGLRRPLTAREEPFLSPRIPQHSHCLFLQFSNQRNPKSFKKLHLSPKAHSNSTKLFLSLLPLPCNPWNNSSNPKA